MAASADHRQVGCDTVATVPAPASTPSSTVLAWNRGARGEAEAPLLPGPAAAASGGLVGHISPAQTEASASLRSVQSPLHSPVGDWQSTLSSRNGVCNGSIVHAQFSMKQSHPCPPVAIVSPIERTQEPLIEKESPPVLLAVPIKKHFKYSAKKKIARRRSSA